MYKLGFLAEFGLSDIQIKIYQYLLENRFSTIENIKHNLNYSYAQVRNNLLYLEQQGFITSAEGKPKIYYRSNPKVALTEILKKRTHSFREKIEKLDKNIQAYESTEGVCTRNITFYHHSDPIVGIEEISNQIQNAKEEIVLTSLPPSILKKLEGSLNLAFLNGVKLRLYYSILDFEDLENYFGVVTEILRNIKIIIIELKEKTCRFIKFNDLIVNEGNILVDGGYLNSILFIDDNFFHFNGFYMPSVVYHIRNELHAKEEFSLKSVVINPDPVQNVLKVIQEHESIKTRDLSIKSKMGGAKLKEILDFLVNEGIVQGEVIKLKGAGRPKRVYSLIE